MQLYKRIVILFFLTVFAAVLFPGHRVSAQIVLKQDTIPDSVYRAMPPPSEKMLKKDFSFNRRWYQNLVTRDNYYFNARLKLSDVLRKATASHQDQYDSLLSFYPFSTADLQDYKEELDSVIFKTSVGIEIHDPRGKWIDDLYLLAGEAYFYEDDLSNALAAFQYINKTNAPVREKGEEPVIGSRAYTSQPQISIATQEKKSGLHHRPSRNEALLWMARTYIAAGQYDQAQALLSALEVDPLFPGRLKARLNELQAYRFYCQESYDSCLHYLAAAIQGEAPGSLRARWAFIAGQLYEGYHDDMAVRSYRHVLDLKPDPLMAFYARLNMLEVNIRTGAMDFRQGTASLLKMARKEKYERYRSRIYYALAQLAIRAGLPAQAESFLLLSAVNNPENMEQRALTFLLMADLQYDQGQYEKAKLYYDSTASVMGTAFPAATRVQERKSLLAEVVPYLQVISRQDSLRALAALPAEELQARLQKIVDDSLKISRKRSRRAEQMGGSSNPAADLLAGTNPSSPGDQGGKSGGTWYFYNNTLKSRGFTEFRSKWGNRPLADNWRESSGSQRNGNEEATDTAKAGRMAGAMNTQAAGGASQVLSVESLMAPIPTTPEKMKQSDDSLADAYFHLGTLYADRLRQNGQAIHTFDTLLQRFPDNAYVPQTLYRLYLLYNEMNQPAQAQRYKTLLTSRYPETPAAAAMTSAGALPKDSVIKQAVAGMYDTAYINYLSGDYQAVFREKALADSLYPGHPFSARFDLLQAMAVIKTQSDSAGQAAIGSVIAKDKADSAIVEQAQAIQQALLHKQELVEHLSQLQLPEESTDTTTAATVTQPVTPPVVSQPVAPPPSIPDSLRNAVQKTDTVAAKPAVVLPPPKPVTPYKLAKDNPYFVVLAFNRTDKKLIDAGLHDFALYNQAHHVKDSIEVSPYVLQKNQVLLIFRLFRDEQAAAAYYREIKAKSAETAPALKPQDYDLFYISRDNFILLNKTKDYEGYRQFFREQYK